MKVIERSDSSLELSRYHNCQLLLTLSLDTLFYVFGAIINALGCF